MNLVAAKRDDAIIAVGQISNGFLFFGVLKADGHIYGSDCRRPVGVSLRRWCSQPRLSLLSASEHSIWQISLDGSAAFRLTNLMQRQG